MKRLIIHPQDRTTDFLSSIYKDWDEVELHRERLTSRELKQLFHHCPQSTQILLLGHGCSQGLLFRDDDTKDEFGLYGRV